VSPRRHPSEPHEGPLPTFAAVVACWPNWPSPDWRARLRTLGLARGKLGPNDSVAQILEVMLSALALAEGMLGMLARGADAAAMRAHAEAVDAVYAFLPLLGTDADLLPLAVAASLERQGDTDLCASCGSRGVEAPNLGTFALRNGLPGLCIACWEGWLAEVAHAPRGGRPAKLQGAAPAFAPDGADLAVYTAEMEVGVIAYDPLDADKVYVEATGGTSLIDEGITWTKLPDDKPLPLCEGEGEDGSGPTITKTCAEWVAERGRAYLGADNR